MKSLWTAPAVLRFWGKGCSIQELDAFVYWKIVVCKPTMKFCSREWLRRPEGQGGFRPPPYAPLDPLYPLQTAEGYPRTPLAPLRALPLVSRPTGSASGLISGLARSQQPIGCRGACRCMGALPWRYLANTPRIGRRHEAGGGISCAEGDSGPPRDGREPSWARPCEASGAL